MKRAFKVKLKAFFFIFKGVSVDRNCLRPENASLMTLIGFTWDLDQNTMLRVIEATIKHQI